MKFATPSFVVILLILLVLPACEREGIDPISQVEPGPDQTAPVVTLSAPLDGNVIQVLDAVTTITIRFEVVDDIEIDRVVVSFDGSEIAAFDEFRDYRRLVEEVVYANVTDGTHTVSVTATDLTGKSTTETVTITKEPAYTPLYEGEVLYMPFNGDYIDLVNIQEPTVVGNPGFAGESVDGSNAYAGAEASYLTYPTEKLMLENEFSAVFWMKVIDVPNRAGILVIGPPDPNNPDNPNNRTGGFRFFREGIEDQFVQRFKLNIGTGAGDSWFDGGEAADVRPETDDWHHFAISMSADRATVMIDGVVVSQGELPGPVDWTGADVLSIMSGAPRFTGWNHLADHGFMDELRIFDRALTQEEVTEIFTAEGGTAGTGYTPEFDGEQFYLSFDGEDFMDMVSGNELTVVGSPTLSEDGREGQAYEGAEGAYLTYPTTGLAGNEFSASMWMKLDPDPDRAGILVVAPPNPDNPDANLLTSGFRFFREATNEGATQRFKLNIGTGEGNSWFDGGAAADLPADSDEWHHLAFSIGAGSATVYIDGEAVSTGEFPGVDWSDTDMLTIMSGAPNFVGWGHLSDRSLLDDLRLFDKALSAEEITALYNE
jgi:hypothetical protein